MEMNISAKPPKKKRIMNKTILFILLLFIISETVYSQVDDSIKISFRGEGFPEDSIVETIEFTEIHLLWGDIMVDGYTYGSKEVAANYRWAADTLILNVFTVEKLKISTPKTEIHTVDYRVEFAVLPHKKPKVVLLTLNEEIKGKLEYY
jgi:hypothetical protein